MNDHLYLDANAHVPMHPNAIRTYSETTHLGHPSSPNAIGRAAASALEMARGKIADLIGAKRPDQIIFTAGCTQACQWGLEMFFKPFALDDRNPIRSQIEHPAVMDAFDSLQSKWYHTRSAGLPTYENGMVDLSVNLYGQENKICCIHMQNEIGTIQPIETYTGFVFSDMSQSLGKIPVNVTDLNVDIAVFGAHKFGGPGSFGFIYLKDSSNYIPFGSGSRYFLDRPGTPDVPGAVATAAALSTAIETLETRMHNMMAFQSMLEEGLERLGCEIIGKSGVRSPNTTFAIVPGNSLYCLMKLSEEGIHVGLGSACGSLHSGESRTMSALGRTCTSQQLMRISQWGWYGEKEAQRVVEAIAKHLK